MEALVRICESNGTNPNHNIFSGFTSPDKSDVMEDLLRRLGGYAFRMGIISNERQWKFQQVHLAN